MTASLSQHTNLNKLLDALKTGSTSIIYALQITSIQPVQFSPIAALGGLHRSEYTASWHHLVTFYLNHIYPQKRSCSLEIDKEFTVCVIFIGGGKVCLYAEYSVYIDLNCFIILQQAFGFTVISHLYFTIYQI